MAITEYEDQIQEIVSKPDHSEFIYDFLGVYDIPRATVTKLRKGMNNLAKEAGAVYLKNKLYFREGTGDLMQDYADLQEQVDELGSKPRYLLVTDYQHLLAKDTKTNETLDIEFAKLPQYFDFFLAWNGIEKADFDKENPADVRAAERFAKLYDVVVKDNPDATRKGLNLFLIRILFCLFAEDTNIFEHDLFTNRVKQMTANDGSNFDQFIGSLFGVLDFEKTQRPVDTPSWLNDFPYVDGDLFKDQHESLHFSAKSRKLIIEAGELLKWDQINPDILGSMIQAVASEDSRSHLGMHYTSVPNIMKVIKPLFLDGLREDFEAAKGNENKLQELYDRIGKIKFMDPACGSGNFLIITYKELRQLEIDILIELNNIGVSTMYVPSVTLNQFYGIEIDDFACDVTRLSLWIAEHQMNVKLHEQISDAVRPTLPLQHAGAILNGNALTIEWNAVMRHSNMDEVYLFGNPPYLGAKKQDSQQKKDLSKSLDNNPKYRKIDYIAGWFYLGERYIRNSKARLAFVTTNSICQGEQVSMIWPSLLKESEIFFCYKTIKWNNNAKRNAGVTVSIIGLESKNNASNFKTMFVGNEQRFVKSISPYLVEGSEVYITTTRKNINGEMPVAALGCLSLDGGNLLMEKNQYDDVLGKYPSLKEAFKRYVGSDELIHNIQRYAIWMDYNLYSKFSTNPVILECVNGVETFRRSGGTSAKSVADTPYRFFTYKQREEQILQAHQQGVEEMVSIIIPRVSSENRKYVPMGLVGEDTVVSDAATVVYNSPIWLLGLLESQMHMAWLRMVGGKLETRYRYAAGLVYNTFSLPRLSKNLKETIEECTLDILDIREEIGGTLDEMYGSPLSETNPKPMNPRLLAAHNKLDEVVDCAYNTDGFSDDSQRLTLLLKMYEEKVRTHG